MFTVFSSKGTDHVCKSKLCKVLEVNYCQHSELHVTAFLLCLF